MSISAIALEILGIISTPLLIIALIAACIVGCIMMVGNGVYLLTSELKSGRLFFAFVAAAGFLIFVLSALILISMSGI